MGHPEIIDTGAKSLTSLGFLTVVEPEGQGLFGGYLVVSAEGRPLEFHCTAPVKANRAQEILYGPTLEPFLYGEQIGRSLVDHAKVDVPLILTNSKPVLALGKLIDTPVVLVYPDDPSDNLNDRSVISGCMDGATTSGPQIARVHQYLVELPNIDGETIERQLLEVGKGLDLMEPFNRIDQAIREAQQVGQAARDAA